MIFPKDENVFKTFNSNEDIEAIIDEDFPLLLPIAKSIATQILTNPGGIFTTIKTSPWYYKDFITIIGDAAHGFYPFFGQGASSAFGDCMQIISLLDSIGPSWEKIFPLYQEARKKHMDNLGELSKKGLLRYMRNKRADYDAIFEKLEAVAHTYVPQYIQSPVYQVVMNNPANTADYVSRHNKQRKIAKWLGVPFLTSVLTICVFVYEIVYTNINKKKRV